MIISTSQIPQILQTSEADYQRFLFECFWNWCQIHADNNSFKEQQLVSNTAIAKWFFNEVEKYEREFLVILTLLTRPNKQTLVTQLKICIEQINAIYPSALFAPCKPKTNYTIKLFTNIYPN